MICGTNVRGRRGDLDIVRPDIEMLISGKNSKFHGLRIQQ